METAVNSWEMSNVANDDRCIQPGIIGKQNLLLFFQYQKATLEK